MSNQNITVE